MKKLSKGAFAMVLAGAVTFSVTNTLLFQESSKQVLKENDVAISEAPKKSDVPNQEEKTSNVKNVETKPSLNHAAVEVAGNNGNMTDTTIVANNQNTEGATKTAAASNHSNVTTATPSSGTSSKGSTPTSTSASPGTNIPSKQAPTPAPPAAPSEPAPAPVPAPTPAPPVTNTPSEPAPAPAAKPNAPGANSAAAGNYGQQVAQTVKEENQLKKASNGK